jgi:hypothetical protein
MRQSSTKEAAQLSKSYVSGGERLYRGLAPAAWASAWPISRTPRFCRRSSALAGSSLCCCLSRGGQSRGVSGQGVSGAAACGQVSGTDVAARPDAARNRPILRLRDARFSGVVLSLTAAVRNFRRFADGAYSADGVAAYIASAARQRGSAASRAARSSPMSASALLPREPWCRRFSGRASPRLGAVSARSRCS